MKVGLVQIDGSMPNLALMKLSAYYKTRGSEVLPLGRIVGADLVFASCIFMKNAEKAKLIADQYGAELGGTGVSTAKNLPDYIESRRPDYEIYDINYGMGFLTRGCIRCCPFCVVPIKEGLLKPVASIESLINPRSNRLVLLDNNLLAYEGHLDILQELSDRKLRVCFTQGLDIRLLTPKNSAALAKVRFANTKFNRRQLYFAFDSMAMEPALRNGVAMLKEVGIRPGSLMIYMLCGYNTTRDEDWHRFNVITALGADPFVMLYQGSGEELHHWARWVNRRIYKSDKWENYSRYNPPIGQIALVNK